MKPIKAVIIDDEMKSREVLSDLLNEYCPGIEVVGMGDSVETGVAIIQSTDPNLVFLDIEMQTGTGFDLLEKLGRTDFHVVFTTAYEQYALKAIKFSALDYLLKPIDVKELKTAISKIKAKETSNEESLKIKQLIKNFSNIHPPKITLATADSLVFTSVDEIVRCEAQGAYTTFHLKDKKPILVSKNLKEYQMLLEEFNFFRIHHSHLINLNEIEKIIKADGGSVLMSDGSTVGISTSKKQDFMIALRNHNTQVFDL